jgi:flagellar biosynthesis repressor protein FlbT
MPLKITLKPNERVIIDGSVITNGAATCRLTIENNIPVLREKDIIKEKDACSPCTRIYFCIQLMYIDKTKLTSHHNTYWKLVRDLLDAAPRLLGLMDEISEQVVSEKYYQALKLANKLIDYEKEVIQNELKRTPGIRPGEQNDPFRP